MVKNLKELRQNAGVSQQQLADVVGVSQQSINKYENHSVEPDIQTLITLADYFHTSVDYLIGHIEAESSAQPRVCADLDHAETRLIQNFRQLLPREKESVYLIIDNYQKSRI
ncbi:MAG: helix-turn-helix domain-containing protein [Candidatus Fimenecus sp.]